MLRKIINNTMKMRYLKTFENFDDDMGRFSEPSDRKDLLNEPELDREEEIGCPCGTEGCPECEDENDGLDGIEEEEEENHPEFRRKVWGDEVIEKKKFNFEKKKEDKKDDKKEDKKDDKKESGKGLSAKQKKLPAGLQAAILKRKK